MKNFKKIIFSVLSLVVLFMLSACVEEEGQDTISDKESETEMPTEAEDTAEITSTQGIESLEPVVTLDNALDLFYNTFEIEIVNFESIKLEKDDSGDYLYFIEGWDDKYNYELEIDVGTAEIIEQEMRITAEIGDVLDLDAAVTPKEAMGVALETIENEAVEGWELKVDQTNRMIYKITFLSGSNQKVDALTGKVL